MQMSFKLVLPDQRKQKKGLRYSLCSKGNTTRTLGHSGPLNTLAGGDALRVEQYLVEVVRFQAEENGGIYHLNPIEQE